MSRPLVSSVFLRRFVEFTQPDGTMYHPTEVGSDDLVAVIRGMHARGDVGFRLFSRVVGTASLDDGTVVPIQSDRIDGRTYRVGRLVSRSYVESVRTGSEPKGMTESHYVQLLVGFDAEPDSRLVERIVQKDGRRIINRFGREADFVLVDDLGVEVTDVVGPPEGWTSPTEFAGCDFRVDVQSRVVSVVARAADPGDMAKLDFRVIDPPNGLAQAIQLAATNSGAVVNPREGKIELRTGTEMTILIDAERALQLAFDGAKLRAVLSSPA